MNVFDQEIMAPAYSIDISPEKIAWIAGIIEGEGCFYIRKPNEKFDYYEFKIKVAMTDKDVIDRLYALVPGSRMQQGKLYPNRKPIWHWLINRREIMLVFIPLILPWLGKRRSEKAAEMLDIFHKTKWRYGTATHCPNGHARTEKSIYIHPNGITVSCKICRLANLRKWRKGKEAA